MCSDTVRQAALRQLWPLERGPLENEAGTARLLSTLLQSQTGTSVGSASTRVDGACNASQESGGRLMHGKKEVHTNSIWRADGEVASP